MTKKKKIPHVLFADISYKLILNKTDNVLSLNIGISLLCIDGNISKECNHLSWMTLWDYADDNEEFSEMKEFLENYRMPEDHNWGFSISGNFNEESYHLTENQQIAIWNNIIGMMEKNMNNGKKIDMPISNVMSYTQYSPFATPSNSLSSFGGNFKYADGSRIMDILFQKHPNRMTIKMKRIGNNPKVLTVNNAREDYYNAIVDTIPYENPLRLKLALKEFLD